MPSLQQEVRGRDDPAVGRGKHRGVVAGTEHRAGPGPHPRGHLGDEAELAQVPDTAAVRLRAAAGRLRRAGIAGAAITAAGGVFAALRSLITHKSGPFVNFR
jgi:hypothetical protein